ncbi:hypothetical protein SESBI_02500 [Sesbania bispinosa]|nr:hypothetical protein SESBI_02500 [Sesbania bispinosa]
MSIRALQPLSLVTTSQLDRNLQPPHEVARFSVRLLCSRICVYATMSVIASVAVEHPLSGRRSCTIRPSARDSLMSSRWSRDITLSSLFFDEGDTLLWLGRWLELMVTSSRWPSHVEVL